jgi:hypothetical protein
MAALSLSVEARAKRLGTIADRKELLVMLSDLARFGVPDMARPCR